MTVLLTLQNTYHSLSLTQLFPHRFHDAVETVSVERGLPQRQS